VRKLRNAASRNAESRRTGRARRGLAVVGVLADVEPVALAKLADVEDTFCEPAGVEAEDGAAFTTSWLRWFGVPGALGAGFGAGIGLGGVVGFGAASARSVALRNWFPCVIEIGLVTGPEVPSLSVARTS
jgi:hypothetical protein